MLTLVGADDAPREDWEGFREKIYERQVRRVVVTGGRRYDDRALVRRVLTVLDQTVEAQRSARVLVVHGGAPGLDTLAGRQCDDLGIPVAAFQAEWSIYGNRAGPRRNGEMLDIVEPQLVIAFPGGTGTQSCISAARRRKIPVVAAPGTEL